MKVARMVVETLPGAAPRVAQALAGRCGLELKGGDGDRRLSLQWRGLSGAQLEQEAEDLLAEYADIRGVFPTPVREDVDDRAQPVRHFADLSRH